MICAKCKQVDITHILIYTLIIFCTGTFTSLDHGKFYYLCLSFSPLCLLINIGLLYGAAIGDALGLATRGMSRDECSFYYNQDDLDYSQILQDKHRVLWRAGDWTSNFDSMVGIQNLETFHENNFTFFVNLLYS